jgi:hypothetical protein
MTINDIMMRDILDEEMKAKNAPDIQPQKDNKVCAIIMAVLVVLSMLGVAFAAGIYFESCRALKADCEFTAWLDRIDREAAAEARAMSNYELLNATERKSVTTADR